MRREKSNVKRRDVASYLESENYLIVRIKPNPFKGEKKG